MEKTLRKHETETDEINVQAAKREVMAQAGVKFVVLHGCTSQGCGHVYGPGDNRVLCPACGSSRYLENSTTPKEAVYHFPIRERLEALLTLRSFRKLLEVICAFLLMHVLCYCNPTYF